MKDNQYFTRVHCADAHAPRPRGSSIAESERGGVGRENTNKFNKSITIITIIHSSCSDYIFYKENG